MLGEKLQWKGLKGLYSNYHDCGCKFKLTNEHLLELREILTFEDESYSMDDVQKIIKDNFGMIYDYKTVWTIVSKKLSLNYGKPFIKYSSHPENAEEYLKKFRNHVFTKWVFSNFGWNSRSK